MIDTGFLDTGGAADFAAFNMCTVNIPERKIYIRDTVFWKISEEDKVTFASIRNDISILHKTIKFYLIGCETNNYGRSEMESLRRDYGIRMHGINTTGKITSEDIIKKGESMDKNAVIKFVNSWRQNAHDDPHNHLKLGQIILPKKKSETMIKWMNQLDTFVRKDPEGFGATGQPKYGAEGTGHDDGIMASLGNIFMIKTKIFKIFSGASSIGAVQVDNKGRNVMGNSNHRGLSPPGRSIGRIDDSGFYEGM
jgi:hypothetical protein